MTLMPLQRHTASGDYALELIGLTDERRGAAMALALAGEPAISAHVRWQLDALDQAVSRQGLALDVLAAACVRGRPIAAALAIESPGRSAVVHTAWPRANADPCAAVADAVALAARTALTRGVLLLQAIVDPEDSRLHGVYRDVGFEYLTELLYMDASVGRSAAQVECPPKLRLATYAPNLERAFLAALENSYVDSLDCPGLTGIRKTEDVLAGHRATGVYDPQGWYVVLQDDGPVGVLLTAELVQRRALEIVYIGVSAEARGQSVGKYLMHTAQMRARELGLAVITLAVDAINVPARRLYETRGYRATHRRRVWIMHSNTGRASA